MNAAPPALRLIDISKSFGPVHANREVSLSIDKGTIHGIVGENGAGKSTLMKILHGSYRADKGTVEINGNTVNFASSADAISAGIGMVHQHFMLIPTLSVLDNLLLGDEGGFFVKAGREDMRARLAERSKRYGLKVDPDAVVGDLPVGLQQRVEILKALKGDTSILILDEPTAVLTPQETEQLFEILRNLRDSGVTIILVTHKLEEIMAVTEDVSVMRQGQLVAQRQTNETTPEELAELMVGRKVLLRAEMGEASRGDTVLKVHDLGLVTPTGGEELAGIDFEVRAGEILGIAGVAGNGQSELLEILGGMRAATSGTMEILGQTFDATHPPTPGHLREIGLGHIPEDRHRFGLVLSFPAFENAPLGYLHKGYAGDSVFLDKARMRTHCKDLMDHHDVRPTLPDQMTEGFSGGNQQKLVIAREMHERPKILIIGQPTRGVDIGAIEFIHKDLIAHRDDGAAILLVSVELEEIFALSDRIMVMNDGKTVGIVDREDADRSLIGQMMAGIAPGARADNGVATP
ncbi:MAG: ABC transporter ATP-binding protein [Pseudomonadota bacterium]